MHTCGKFATLQELFFLAQLLSLASHRKQKHAKAVCIPLKEVPRTISTLQELSFLLGSALPVPPTLRRRWLRCDSLTKRLRQQVELLQEARPRAIIGGILQSLPDDSRFHDLLYEKPVEQT